MSFVEVISDITENLSSVKQIRVLGVILQPFSKDGKNMSCYTSLDLSNPTLFEYNSCLRGDYLKMYCIYSNKYIILNNNKSIRKKPINDKCSSCSFTPSEADYFEVIIDCVILGKSTVDDSLMSGISKVLTEVGKKFNINIGVCTIKPKRKGSISDG